MFTIAGSSFGVRLAITLILIMGMLGVQSPTPVLAATLTVTNTNDSGAGSLRQAITSSTSGGIIVFDPSLAGQTTLLSSTLLVDKNLTIDGSLLSTRINISGNNQVMAFGVNPNVTLTLKSLIIKDGKSSGGAGITNAGTLTVMDSLFFGNHTEFDPTVLGGGYGGAIYSWGAGELTVTNSTFQGNTGSRGGAIYCAGGTMTVVNSTFLSNSVSPEYGDGGAIFDYCTSTIANSTFSANTAAGHGGAILTDNDINPTQVTNSTFYGNTALSGGGIASYGGLIVKNSTFSHNISPNGGAIYNGIGGVLSLRSSILANSVGGVDCIKSDGAPAIENINNLIETTGADFESCGISLLTSDPLLGLLQDNGGFTQTMALLPNSPAINAGDDGNCPSTDQRGVARPQGGQCDMGAYEKTATFEDVQLDYWAWSFIERLYDAGITGGCSVNPLQYCPEGMVTRAQIAVFLERSIHGSSYTPPAVGASTGFGDVSTTYWAAAWIKQLYADGITGGCGVGIYCPEGAVTRAQMAVFLLRSKHGASYVPPAVGSSTGFGDVSTTYWAAAWIKQLVAEGITSGCGSGTYCPEAPVTRAQMAVFLVRTFGLP